MAKFAINTLEFTKVREKLSQYAGTAMGQRLAMELMSSSRFEEVKLSQEETAEAVRILDEGRRIPLGGITDISGLVKRTRVGSLLDPEEFKAIQDAISGMLDLKAFLKEVSETAPALVRYSDELHDFSRLSKQLSSVLDEKGNIKDTASVKLSGLRTGILVARNRVKDKLSDLLHDPNNQKYFQDALVTMREDRYVIPIKQEYRLNFPGIVHDQSSSGATLFIEPMAVVNLNNDIKKYVLEEKAEVERILRTLTSHVGAEADHILESLAVVAQVDLISAKALYAEALGARRPMMVLDHHLRIVKGRHPLLEQESIVPLDIELGQDFTTLLITGPNTGGKTVALKTVGLFALMAQAGLFLPAEEAIFPVFSGVYADIGDEQSIEQSLSTFSGHMKNMISIIREATDRDLVLVDEVCVGTDPTEGAALAMAMIEHFYKAHVLTIMTTHYSELKTFAYEHEGMQNASVEFDPETLRPTYKLSVGVPGKSNAFLISEKLGIPERVIEAAQQHLSAEDKRLDAVLGQLDDLKLQLKASQDEVEGLKNEAAHQLDAARQKRDELIQQGENELEAARAKARALAQEVESKAYALTDELRQLQKDERMSTQQKAQRAREIAKKESEKLFMGTEVVHKPVKEFVPLKEVKVGQEVCIAELNQLATVLSLPDKNGDVLVRAGIIKTKVPLKGLKQPEKLVKETKPQTKAQQRYSRLTGDANRPNGRVERVQRTAKMECNLLGLTVDEALPEVDSFIDRAILNGQTVVYLIHGNGTGALRTAIHKHLRGNRMVKSFRLGRYGEGESGVTVVELK